MGCPGQVNFNVIRMGNMSTEFRVGVADYTISGSVDTIPITYWSLIEHAVLHDDFDLSGSDGTLLVIAVAGASGWPTLLISQRFEPGPEAGFHPGVFLVRESHILFVGAGTRLLAYDLRNVRRLWEEVVYGGFWGWRRHGDMVLMAAELELAAWDLSGRKRWSTFVEPPWYYAVRDGRVELDIMGEKSSFDLEAGPNAGRAG
jgi:hypothetical protein